MNLRALYPAALGILMSASVAFAQHLPASARVDSLVAALRDTSALSREHAAETLGSLGPAAASAGDSLLLLLSDVDPYVVGAATDALARIGTSVLPGISRMFSDSRASGKFAAINVLGKLGPAAAPLAPVLGAALTDSNADIRWSAAYALGAIGPPARATVPRLLQCLYDIDEDVRSRAARALDRVDPAAVEHASSLTAVTSWIDSLLIRLMQEEKVPGASIVLIRDREIVWTRCAGVADTRTGALVTDSTMFEACSMSKPVFATLVMRLVEQGAAQLDLPLSDILTLSALAGEPEQSRITARMVLSHTTGLPNWRRGGDEMDCPMPLLFAPGSRFGYSGEGFEYLQKVVEKVTGKSLDVFAERELFSRLGLRHASYIWSRGMDPLIAAGHDAAGVFNVKTRYTHPNAAYSLYVSAIDYARFIITFLPPPQAGQVYIHRKTIDSMFAHSVRVNVRDPVQRPGKSRGGEAFWGLGWAIDASPAGDIVYHAGSNGSGFRCFSQFNPGTGSGIVIMTNGAGGTHLWERIISRIGDF